MIPRLVSCMDMIIASLRSHGVTVETSDAFLLDLTQCPYVVPRALDGIPVQMSFAGSIPDWADRIRYHLHVCLVGQRRWSICEPPKGFNVPLIVSRIMKQLDTQKREHVEREQAIRDKELAEERIARLGQALGVFQESPLRLAQDNLTIEGQPDSPNDVQVTVRTSHANAEKIAREFRLVGRRRRP